MKRFLTIIICLFLLTSSIVKLPWITDKITTYFYSVQKVTVPEKNFYAKNQSFEYVKVTDDFVPYNFQDLLNIFYTVLDSGYETFTFYCPVEYQDCVNDVKKISDKDNSDILNALGNYVATFNNFESLIVQYYPPREVTLVVKYNYSEEDIRLINSKLDDLWNLLVKDGMDKEDIIYAFHDYFINNTKYDQLYEEEIKQGKKTTYDSSRAIGVLFQGYAICSGYTDAMALVLDRLNIPNFKVSSDTHVWNVLYIDDTWKHIDLTWDDPVPSPNDPNGTDVLLHKFYLISTETLEGFDIEDHTFDKSVYLEIK